MIEVEPPIAKEEQAKRGNRADDSQYCGDPQHQADVPCCGLIPIMAQSLSNASITIISGGSG